MFVKNKIKSRTGAVLTRGKFIFWSEVLELKKSLSFFAGCKFCISVASGIGILQVVIMSLGTVPGDKVLAPSFLPTSCVNF